MSEPTWEVLGGGGVIGGPIDYVGVWAAGTTYQPGQVVRHNGVDYLAVNPSIGQTPPVASPSPPTLPGIGAKLQRDSIGAQSIPNITATIITWPAVPAFDSSGFYSSGAPNRFTVPAGLAGLFLVFGSLRWTSMAGGTVRRIEIGVNGTMFNHYKVDPSGSANAFTQESIALMRLAAGDYVQLGCYQDSGGAMNVSTGTSFDDTSFSIARLGS